MVSNKQVGKNFETRVQETLDKYEIPASKVPFSGAGKCMKGDIHATIGNTDFVVECKKTRGKEYWSLERWILDKVEQDAKHHNRLPLLVFSFQNSKLYTIMPLDQLISLLEKKEP